MWRIGASLALKWAGRIGLRVVAGNLRGRNLVEPPRGVRPTSDRVRESIFGRLGRVDGLRVLDLFAGTGALGIEAISRGAERLVSVDRSRASVVAIQKNVERLGIVDCIEIMRLDSVRAIRRLAEQGRRFDLVFLDPPYAEPEAIADVLQGLKVGGLLAEQGVVVAEGPKRHPLVPNSDWEIEEFRHYGDTVVYWLVEAEAGSNERVAGGSKENR